MAVSRFTYRGPIFPDPNDLLNSLTRELRIGLQGPFLASWTHRSRIASSFDTIRQIGENVGSVRQILLRGSCQWEALSCHA